MKKIACKLYKHLHKLTIKILYQLILCSYLIAKLFVKEQAHAVINWVKSLDGQAIKNIKPHKLWENSNGKNSFELARLKVL